ncbi:MAG: MATE family efflux transporter, partial [Brevinema sp.]
EEGLMFEEDKSISLLESDNITSSIVRISLPMMVTGFLDALYSMIDSIFVGRFVGKLALAALAVNGVLHMILLSVGGLFAVGTSSVLSRALGAKNYHKVKQTLVTSILTSVVILVFLSLLVLLKLDNILRYMGSSEDVLYYSRDYAQVLLWFGFVIPLNAVLLTALRSKGAVKILMIFSLTGSLTNIMLDALFIVVFGWEVKGAAFATIISQLIVLVLAFNRVSSEYKIKITQFYFFHFPVVKEIFSIGILNFLRMTTFTLMNVIANRALAIYGATAVASYGILMRFLHLAYQPIFGSNLGTQTLIGYNYGANRFLKVKHIILKGYTLATIIGFIPTIIFLIAPVPMFYLFTDDPKIIHYLVSAIRMVGTSFFLYGFQIFSTGALIAMGHKKEAFWLSILRPMIMAIAMAILPIFYQEFGVWLAFPVTDTLSSLLIAFVMYYELSKLKRKEALLQRAL